MTRQLNPDEFHGCFVGSGECKVNATHETDDGSGGVVYICAFHLVEFERMENLVQNMSAHKLEQFEAAVEEAHKQNPINQNECSH